MAANAAPLTTLVTNVLDVQETMFDSHKTQSVIRRVAIVGSGLAGLVTATRLRAAGVEVTLFEKSRGPGGRMAAKRLPEPADGSADIGAQYFTIRNPEFRQFLDRYAGPDAYGEWTGVFRYQDREQGWQDMRPAQRYVGIPRMSAITRAISRDLEVRTGVRIARLKRDSDGLWQLRDNDGQVHERFDAVVLTPPPAQTVELLSGSGLAELAGDLNIRVSHMQACWTVVLHFPEGTGASFQALMPDSRRLHWIANNSSKPGRDDEGEWWVLHADPDWSDAHTDMPPEQVREALLEEFRACSGITAVHRESLVHRWLYARPRARTTPGHLWFRNSHLAIAGDWLEGGRVEGAYNSACGLVGRLESEGLIPGPR